MSFRLHLESPDGDNRILLWNPKDSSMIWEDNGQSLIYQEEEVPDYKVVEKFSPSKPLKGKSASVKSLKIQMGLSCNYDCSYCSQAVHQHEATVSLTNDVDEFLKNIDWIEGEPEKVQFWGGEPFVYWAKLKRMVPALRAKWPSANFGMVTNGSLIKKEQLEFIEEFDIGIAMSHDGPGQYLRGPDPLEDPEIVRSVRYLTENRPNKFNFTAVLTQKNNDPDTIREYLSQRVGVPVRLDFEGIVHSHDERVGGWTQEDYSNMKANIVSTFLKGNAANYGLFEMKMGSIIQNAAEQRSQYTAGQKCGMDQRDQIAVDLKGNVMTCHSVGAQGEHNIGKMDNVDAVELNTSWLWTERPDCPSCPVQPLCGGSCMYLDGEDWRVSCENEYQFNTAILSGVVFTMTGMLVTKIEGKHTRPHVTRKLDLIPVVSIAA